MRIPDVQARLRALAGELDELADQLSRRKGKKGRITSNKVTADIAAAIGLLREKFPDMSQAEIARSVGVNPGRVSERLKGKRHAENPR